MQEVGGSSPPISTICLSRALEGAFSPVFRLGIRISEVSLPLSWNQSSCDLFATSRSRTSQSLTMGTGSMVLLVTRRHRTKAKAALVVESRPVILYHETPVKGVFYSSNFLSEFKDHQNTTDISKKIMTNPSMISML